MTSGDPVKMAMANVGKNLPPPEMLQELSESLSSLLPLLSVRYPHDLALPFFPFLFPRRYLKARLCLVFTQDFLNTVDTLVL